MQISVLPSQHWALFVRIYRDKRYWRACERNEVRVRGTLMDMNAAQEVLAAAESRAVALAVGDAERLTDLLHEDFRWTAHVGDTYDRAEYIRRNTEGHTVWRSQALVNAEVVVVGETAVLYAEVHDVVRSEGDGSEAFRMPMTQVWVHTGSQWKCLAGHAGPRLS